MQIIELSFDDTKGVSLTSFWYLKNVNFKEISFFGLVMLLQNLFVHCEGGENRLSLPKEIHLCKTLFNSFNSSIWLIALIF